MSSAKAPFGRRAATGRVHYRRLDAAIKEFEAAHVVDTRVLVARGVKILKWMDRNDKYSHRRYRKISYEVEYLGVDVDENTTGDVYIIKIKAPAYYQATIVLIGTVYRYQLNRERFRNISSTINCELVCAGRVRELNLAIFNIVDGKLSQQPCFLAEIEVQHRSLPAVHLYCIQHFLLIPSLRAALLLKFFPRHPDTLRFAAVAVLYRRTATGPSATDAVSFGSCPPPPSAVPTDVARVLRSLPDAPCRAALEPDSPWPPALRPFLTVPAEDLTVPGNDVRGPSYSSGVAHRGLEVQDTTGDDLVVDLWRVLESMEKAHKGGAAGVKAQTAPPWA